MSHLSPAVPGFSEFEFDLPKALLRDLIGVLDDAQPSDLRVEDTSRVPEAQGVYQLFHDDELVYIGKTDAEAGLRTRLSRHARKIQHRPKLTGRVTFKAVQILVFTAMDLETQLIKHYRCNGKVAWNGSGFGSNDPGRERETTNKKPEGFDALYPISIHEPLEIDSLVPGESFDVASGLAAIKSALPYTLRYETERNEQGKAKRGRAHPDMLTATFVVPEAPYTADSLMRAIATSLGSEWQATVFDSNVILYKEDKAYKYGQRIIAKMDDQVSEHEFISF